MAGEGILANAVAYALADIVEVKRRSAGIPVVPSLLVEVSDSWSVGTDRAEPVVRTAAAPCPHLPVRVEIRQLLVGPMEMPGNQGCAACLELRRRRTRENPERHDALVAQHGDELGRRPSGWVTGLAGSTVGSLVADECRRLLEPSGVPRTESAVFVMDLASLSVVLHSFLADPLCPRCGRLPEDGRELADIVLRARPKLGPTTYRVRDLGGEVDALEDTYIDAQCGMVSSLVSGTYGGVAVSIAASRCRPHDASEPGFGRASTFPEARLTALLEALERFGGAAPGGRYPAVVASYEQVAEHAVDPRAFGLHPDKSYRLPEFGFQPFAPSSPARWIWGYSFERAAPVLVPEGAAFWHTHPETRLRPFFFEISNGCALGSCLEEAVLHGLLEVIERDAFLMTWYSSLALPRIDLRGAPSREVRLVSSVISADTGCEVLAFDTTMEHGVPSVWVMAVHPDDHVETAKMICSAAAHLDPEKAVVSALNELGPARASLDDTFPGESARAREMLDDPLQVQTMTDHSLLYGAYEAFARLDFLTGSSAARDLGDMTASVEGAWRDADLTKDLRDVIDRLGASGMDVIVVDQTTPEHRLAGLHCVKVLVPGSLSMTFGHQHRRTDGISRLDHVPGLVDTSAGRPAEARSGLNPHPHPFP